MTHPDRAPGVALALLAAGLFVAMPQGARAHSDGEDEHAHAELGVCEGGNSCQGQSACKSANSQCAGQNACKGQGFTITGKAACDEAGGQFEQT